MKNIMLTLLCLITTNLFATTTLFCHTVSNQAYYHALLKGKAVLECSTAKFDMSSTTGITGNRKFKVEIANVGIGLFGADTDDSGAVITLFCPSVRKNAMGVSSFINKKGKQKKGVTDFYGLRASAAFLFGADAAVFSNKRAGVCILAGLSSHAAGASVSGSKMTVELVGN